MLEIGMQAMGLALDLGPRNSLRWLRRRGVASRCFLKVTSSMNIQSEQSVFFAIWIWTYGSCPPAGALSQGFLDPAVFLYPKYSLGLSEVASSAVRGLSSRPGTRKIGMFPEIQSLGVSASRNLRVRAKRQEVKAFVSDSISVLRSWF